MTEPDQMRHPPIFARVLPAALACLLALATSACSNAPEGNDYVDYDGTTLTVEGTEFKRVRETSFDYKVYPGRIVISAWPAALPRTLVHIKRYGLTLEGHTENGRLLVKVPEGYEWQWAAAIESKLGRDTAASTDPKTAPLPMLATGPGPGLRSVAQMGDERYAKAAGTLRVKRTPAPRDPLPAEVRQAYKERYAALEKMGGMTFILPTTGASTVVRARLYDVSKITCSPSIHAPQSSWDCNAVIKRSICSGNCTPSFSDATEVPERMSVTWNAETQRFEP